MAKLRGVDLHKSYRGRKVVNDVSVEIEQREVVGLLGPNGAGKTTTFYLLVGLTRADAGQVLLDGDDITGLPMYLRARMGISYLPQEPSVFRKLTVEENLIAVLETLPLTAARRRDRLEGWAGQWGWDGGGSTGGHSLWGGEGGRGEFGGSLGGGRAFVVGDEPFSGIDPVTVIDIQKIIRGLSEAGIGVLVTDHNVRETLRVTSRAYIINDGRIFRAGTPERLSEDPEVRRVYLGENFSLN